MSTKNNVFFNTSRRLTEKVTPQIIDFVSKVLEKDGLQKDLHNCWNIFDVADSLVLVHYNEKFNPNDDYHAKLKKIRGLIVDVNTGAKFTVPYGYVKDIIISSYVTSDEENLSFLDCNNQQYVFKNSETKFSVGLESSVLRFFKFNGKIYASSSTKIDASGSHWGDTEKFLDAFLRLSGLKLEDMFGSEQTSPYCHSFVIAGPTNLSSMLHECRVTYIGTEKSWSEELYASKPSDPYYFDGEFFKFEPKNLNQNEPDPLTTESYDRPLTGQRFVTTMDVNKLLFPEILAKQVPFENEKAKNREMFVKYQNNGEIEEVYYSNPFFNPSYGVNPYYTVGNFVIMFNNGLLYKISTPGYHYRCQITENDPSPYHHWVMTLHSVIADKNEPSTIQPLLKPNGQPYNLANPDEFREMWFVVFHSSVGPARRKAVSEFRQKYNKDIMAVTTFIKEKLSTITESQFEILYKKRFVSPETRKRMNDILKYSAQRVNKTKKYDEELTRLIYTQLSRNEKTVSIYKLMSFVSKFNKFPDPFMMKPTLQEEPLTN